MNVQKDCRRWKKAPMTVFNCFRSILMFLDICRKFCRIAASDFDVCIRLPIWEGSTANLHIFWQNCRNLIEWVASSGKIMQECRFDPYVGNDLLEGLMRAIKVCII